MTNEKIQNHKLNISYFSFISLLSLISTFILIFSINFLILQFNVKQDLINKIINDFQLNGKPSITIEQATSIFHQWSLPIYIGGVSGLIVFAIFIISARSKIEYGYIFRTIWLVVLLGASIFIFFSPYELWLNLVIFFLLLSMAGIMCHELLLVNRKRILLRMGIRQEWYNKREKIIGKDK
ncbi:MAG: hypothetical protein KFW07_02360 [Mycoplasmataceae bacterium]|nr:hypothetical protein [Mycoplasmataceae bacterium]